MNVCCCLESETTAEQLRRLARETGWNCWICQRPEDFALFLAGIAEDIDLIVSDSLTSAESLVGEHAVSTATSCILLNQASADLPRGWHAMTARDDEELTNQIYSLVSLARLTVEELNPDEYEPITGFAFEEAFRRSVEKLGRDYCLVCLEICHGPHLYDALDPLSRTDLLAALASEVRNRVLPDTIIGFDSAYRYYLAIPGRSRPLMERILKPLVGAEDCIVHHRSGTARIGFVAGITVAGADMLNAAAAAARAVQNATRRDPIRWADEPVPIARNIPAAIERDEFSIMLQPQWRISDHKLTGAEALIRWQGLEVGNLQPDQFIPVAERAGSMTRIGDWVLDSVSTASQNWLELKLDPIYLTVNVSPQQFKGDALWQRIRKLIEHDWLDPTHLELEIPQSGLETLLDEDRTQVFALKDLGVRLALDHLGVVPIEPSRLLRLPVDTLKLDRQLIARLDNDDHARLLVEKLVELASSYRLRSVAVGVESDRQLELLAQLGCTDAQGYLLSEPMTTAQFRELLIHGFHDGLQSAN